MTDVSWRVLPGQRIGLVGSNGCGKSTLLRCLSGQRRVDGGKLLLGPTVELGYLEQTAVTGSQLTVWEEAKSRMTAIIEAEAALDSALKRLEAGEASAAADLAEAQDAFAACGGTDADKRIANVLSGLGFQQTDWTRKASEFSGGWQMRIALARLLLGPAGQSAANGGKGGLLLLDEPTNHLDAKAIEWLASFLASSTGTCVIVSHDESLLERACERIVEVRGGELHHYTGSYRSFLSQRKEREDQARATSLAEQAEIARLEDFVRRFGANASKASQAKSREKVLNKMRENAVEMPAAASSSGPGDASKASMRFLAPPPCHREVITMKGATVGWSAEKPPLITGLDLVVEKGMRVLVLGANGTGKSTLLKSIAGEVALLSGTRKLGEGAKLAVFSQDLAQDLPLDSPALDYVLAKARLDNPDVTLQMGMRSLGSLGLPGSMASRLIGQLSGGEKARVALAAFALIPYNCLLLDEASNHLDVGTIEMLTQALKAYEGALVAITHNSLFAAGLEATHVLRVENGAAVLGVNYGLSSADFDHAPAATTGAAPGSVGAPKKAPKRAPRLSEEEEREAAIAAARAERFAKAGNVTAEADTRPKSKLERQAMQRAAAEKEKQDKIETKARGGKRR